MVSDRSTTLEVEAAEEGTEMVLVYSGGVPEQRYVSVEVPNDVRYCIRARLTVSGVTSGWSAIACATPRLDPEPPSFELSLEPRAACIDSPAANVRIDAVDGNPHLVSTIFPDGRESFDPDTVVSGVAEMKVFIDANPEDAVWEPYSEQIGIDIGSAPSANVGVLLRDAFGNESRMRILHVERCDH